MVLLLVGVYLLVNDKRILELISKRSREEKGIPLRILPFAPTIILTGIELLPHTSWEDVFVPFVPASINDLCHVRIVVETFEARVEGSGLSTAGYFRLWFGRSGQGIIS